MNIKEIQFVALKEAKLVDKTLPDEIGPNQVLSRTIYTIISSGTERANILDLPNTFAYGKWPKVEGYDAISVVEKVGTDVKKVKAGDRVLVYHGTHASYSLVDESRVFPVKDNIKDEEAVLTIIGAMGICGLRKTRLELGESNMVIGLGLLGMFALMTARNMGAYPLIAVDFNEQRRKLALELGADYAFDPRDAEFVQKVKDVTDEKGVDTIVEVTGSGRALETALAVVAKEGRIALSGCTRINDVNIDWYKQVHCPGITIIGAHNSARPKCDSSNGNWTNEDDVYALCKMIAGKRFNVTKLVNEIHSPNECFEIYQRLVNDEDFPLGVLFDWRLLK